MDTHPATTNKPSGLLKTTAKVSTCQYTQLRTKAAPRHAYPGAAGDVSGTMIDTPTDTTTFTTDVESKAVNLGQ
jgi:hypothetical protein